MFVAAVFKLLYFDCFVDCYVPSVQNWHKKYRSLRETVFAFVSGVRAFHAKRLGLKCMVVFSWLNFLMFWRHLKSLSYVMAENLYAESEILLVAFAKCVVCCRILIVRMQSGMCGRYMEALPCLNVAYQMNDRLRECAMVSSLFVALDTRILAYYRRQCLLVCLL